MTEVFSCRFCGRYTVYRRDFCTRCFLLENERKLERLGQEATRAESLLPPGLLPDSVRKAAQEKPITFETWLKGN